jgi:Protein of unknown function (DUF3306)
VLEAEPLPVVPPPQPSPAGGGSKSGFPAPPEEGEGGGTPEPPPLTLADAQALTTESDFRPFIARDVAPEVKNAAMKKLFSDPHFNVMDRLDTYIDDYTQPDPIPPAMLRSLASAKFLGLFDEEERQEREAKEAREAADNLAGETVAQSAAAPVVPPALPDDNDPDLRLQPDHAPPGQAPGGSVA